MEQDQMGQVGRLRREKESSASQGMNTPFRMTCTTLLLSLTVHGCAKPVSVGIIESLAERQQQRSRASELNRIASAEAKGLSEQRQLLEEALLIDELAGEVHNNLGIVLYRQGHYYEAAQRLQRASELLAGSATPPANLALLHVDLGRWDRALAHARAAYERDSHHLGAIKILAVCLIESGSTGRERQALLKQLVLLAEDDPWRMWALRQLKASQDAHCSPE